MHAPALTPVDVSSIRATAEPWVRACIERDWDALLEMCTDDVVFLPPDEPIVPSDRVRAWLEAYPEIETFDFDFDHIEGQDHLAVAYGTFRMTVTIEGRSVALDGKFHDTFRRDDRGKWLYAIVIWNSSQPAGTR